MGGVVINPEGTVESVAIQADAGGVQRRGGQRRKGLAKKGSVALLLAGWEGACVIRIHPAAGAVVRDLDEPGGVGGKAVPAGPTDIRAPNWKLRRGEGARVIRFKMEDGLRGRPHDVLNVWQQAGCPSAGGDEGGIGLPFLTADRSDASAATAFEKRAWLGNVLVDLHPGGTCFGGEPGDDAAAFHPAANGI